MIRTVRLGKAHEQVQSSLSPDSSLGELFGCL